MSDQSPNENSLPLDHSHTLLTSFSSFLTISIHNILFYRHLYPQPTFLSAKAFNLPVHQSRHPKVCAWITDAVSAVSAQLATGKVSLIAVVIHSPFTSSSSSSSFSSSSSSSSSPHIPGGAVLERYIFDVSRFPTWPAAAATAAAAAASSKKTPAESMRVHGDRIMAKEFRQEKARDDYLDSDSINFVDVDEQFRACLRRAAHAMEGMDPLPEGCGFTVAVELKKEGEAPIAHPQEWIPSQPNLQPAGSGTSVQGQDKGGVKTTAVRSVEAGPLFFECWVEEGEAKDAFIRQQQLEGGTQES